MSQTQIIVFSIIAGILGIILGLGLLYLVIRVKLFIYKYLIEKIENKKSKG